MVISSDANVCDVGHVILLVRSALVCVAAVALKLCSSGSRAWVLLGVCTDVMTGGSGILAGMHQ